MPKSRQNKDRKQNLINYKSKHKKKNMSETNTLQMPEIKQIRQVPVWKQDDEFVITGTEFLALQNFFNLFAEPITSMQEIFKRHLDSGTIQVKYQDNEGREMPKEEVEEYLREMQEYFANQNGQNVTVESVKTEATATPAPSPKKLKTSKTETPA